MPPRPQLALMPNPSPCREFEKGAWLFKQGDPATSFFIIEQGQVQLTVTLGSSSGDSMDLPILKEGDTLGDLAVITERSRSASARALSKVRVIEISTEEFNEAISTLPDWGHQLVKGLAGKLASLHARLSQETISKLATAIETVRMTKELQIAQAAQDTLFPKNHQDYGTFEVAGHFEPASECSGDWWYHSQVGERLFIWIGDATGHGVGAALIMSAARAIASVLEKSNAITPSRALGSLNQTISELTRGKQMMTFFIASFDPTTRRLTYANASHEPVILFRKLPGPTPTYRTIYLEGPRGPRLGEDPETEYKESQVQIEPGDLLFAYTDGLPEVQNLKRRPWGELRMLKAIHHSLGNTVSALKVINDIRDEFSSFAKNSRRLDDITFLAFHLRDQPNLSTGLQPSQLDLESSNQILGFDSRIIPFLPVGILKGHPEVLLLHSDWFKEHFREIPKHFLSRSIMVGSALSDLDCITLALQNSLRHIVQASEARLYEDTAHALQMIERPELFLKDPISHLFTTPPTNYFKQRISSPKEKKAAIAGLKQFLTSRSNIHSSIVDATLQQADELMMNALYSAPIDSDGNPLFQEMNRREMASISSPIKATLYAVIHEAKLLIACQDAFGSLNIQSLFQKIRTCFEAGPGQAMNLSSQGGAGIGSFLVYSSSKTYYLFLSKGKTTFIGSVVPLGLSMKRLSSIPKSIHIISEE